LIHFLAGIACSASLFLIFRGFEKFKVHTFQAIVVNYFVCVGTGMLFLGDLRLFQQIGTHTQWLPLAVLLGGLFISTFYLMGYTAQKISVSASSTASKISLIVPVLFSLWIFKTSSKIFDFVNYFGILLVLIAIGLTSVKTQKTDKTNKNELINASNTSIWLLLLPFAVFAMSGAIDTLISYTSQNLLKSAWETVVFPIMLFGVAGGLGSIILAIMFFRKTTKFELKNLIAGVVLGIPNYFSVYFLLKSLSEFDNNGAVLFPIFNISVILLSTVLAIIFFKEKLNFFNKIGVLVAIMAIIAITYQEIFGF
jgi:drug/metabolite transporter (DMT)-like permease